MRSWFQAGVAALLLCSAGGAAWAAPAQILIIRHAEKPAKGKDLSPQGYAHAQELVRYFETSPEVLRFGTPVAIYAMSASDADKSRRPVETVTPLAQALGLSIIADFGKDDLDAVASAILGNPAYDGRMVLLCWEHHVIPLLARALGAGQAPASWSDDDFTSVWELDYSGSQVTGFTTFQQQL